MLRTLSRRTVPDQSFLACMMRKCVLPGLVLAMSLAGPVLAGAEQASLAQDIVPVLTQRCVMCHIPGAAQSGLDLYTNPWSAVVGVKSTQSPLQMVEPGDPDKSYLYLKLTGAHLAAGGSGGPMPLPPGQLDAGQIELIRAWIAQGAPNN